jgi:hypothetical protein
MELTPPLVAKRHQRRDPSPSFDDVICGRPLIISSTRIYISQLHIVGLDKDLPVYKPPEEPRHSDVPDSRTPYCIGICCYLTATRL